MTREDSVAFECPREGLRHGPTSGPIPIEAEFPGEPVQAVFDEFRAVSKLEGTGDRRHPELSFTDQRFRVDRQPRLSLRSQHVVAVKILMDKHLVTLGCGQRFQEINGDIDEFAFEGSTGTLPAARELTDPALGFHGERLERGARRLPEPRKQTDHDVERFLAAPLGEVRSWHAPLEEEGVTIVVVVEEADRAISVPVPQRGGFLFAFPAGVLDLQDGVALVEHRHRDDEREMGIGVRLAQTD